MTDDNWPPFLDHLNTDPKKAEESFLAHLTEVLKGTPPYHLRMWIDKGCGENIDEAIFEVYYHCRKENFYKLRKFEKKEGGSFRKWILTVADYLLIAQVKKWEKETPPPVSTPRTPKIPLPPMLVAVMRECLEELSKYRQILINARYLDGLPPREVIEMFDDIENTEHNRKKISFDTKKSREMLENCVNRLTDGFGNTRIWREIDHSVFIRL